MKSEVTVYNFKMDLGRIAALYTCYAVSHILQAFSMKNTPMKNTPLLKPKWNLLKMKLTNV